MSAILLNGKEVSARIRSHLKRKIKVFAEEVAKPSLAVVLVGQNPASEIYVKAKQKAALEVGIRSFLYRFPESVSQAELLGQIKRLNEDASVHGILVQLPLPQHLKVRPVIDAIAPEKDVDGFHPQNIGNLQLGKKGLYPCTPYGVMQLLKEYKIELQGRNAVVVGHSQIVGRPMATMLLNENATVSVCHAFTENLRDFTRRADLLVVAVGKKHLITADMVKPGAIVVDVGINRENKKLYGDCDFEAIREIASYITPVPGGVGPMTIAMLLSNTLTAARLQTQHALVSV